MNLKHDLDSSFFETILPFLIYGEAHRYYAIFYDEQETDKTSINLFKGDRNIDEKCPYTACKDRFGNLGRLDKHIKFKHKSYRKQMKAQLSPFWNFLI
jgi:hypothetical protein